MVETHCLTQFWSFTLEKKNTCMYQNRMASFWNSHTISNHQKLHLGADIFQVPGTSTEIWYIASKLLISSQKELRTSSTNNPLVKKGIHKGTPFSKYMFLGQGVPLYDSW